MLDQLDVQHQVALALFALLVGEAAFLLARIRFDSHGLKSVGTFATVDIGILVAVLTQVVVRTSVAVIPLSTEDFAAAGNALLDELGGIAIMQMPQYHQRRVLRPSQLVELVVVTSAKIQERLAIVEELAIKIFVIVVDDLLSVRQ